MAGNESNSRLLFFGNTVNEGIGDIARGTEKQRGIQRELTSKRKQQILSYGKYLMNTYPKKTGLKKLLTGLKTTCIDGK